MLIFRLIRTAFFTFFLLFFDNYKSSEISIGAIIKHPETLRSVLDHLKTKKNCKHEVKKLPFVI